MEIPQNTEGNSRKEELIKKIVEHLAKPENTTYYSYSYSSGVPEQLAREVCHEFIKKGYHAKINHFTDKAVYQCFVISKIHCSDTNARLVYSEVLG